MNSLMQDVRYASRQLRKSPGFALTVIVTLALGIGANAAVFTLFDQVLLRMLPVQNPKELVRFEWTGGFSGSNGLQEHVCRGYAESEAKRAVAIVREKPVVTGLESKGSANLESLVAGGGDLEKGLLLAFQEYFAVIDAAGQVH